VSTLQNQLALTEREETARAIRILLRTPTLRQQSAAEDFELVRRRRVAVTEWFDHTLGWTVDVQPRSGVVRLHKVAPGTLADGDDRPARRARSGTSFDRIRYVLFCVLAAELVTRRMSALGELADAVVHACAVDEALPAFDTGRHQHRRAFVDALLLLEDLGALVAVDGRTEAFADDAQSAVLYHVDAAALLLLMSSSVGASQVTAGPEDGPRWCDRVLDGLRAEPELATIHPDDVGPRVQRRRRHQVMRALFDDPVVYRDQLPDEQRAYVESISGRGLMRQAADIAGFTLEERAEGWLLVDPDRWSTDEVFPADGASSLAALRLLTALTAAGQGGMDTATLRSLVAELLADNRGWARTYQDDDGSGRLLTEALDLLRRHHLVAARDGVVSALPAAHRYRAATLDATPRTGRHASTALAAVLYEDVELFTIDGGSTP